MTPRNPADRPATEPRTEAGRGLIESLRPWAEAYPDKFLDGWEQDILAIEAEAAQGAAPLDVHVGHLLGVIPPATLVCDTCEVEL